MPGPLPKSPEQRRRRNKDQQGQWRLLPAGGRSGQPPKLPVRSPAWLKATRSWWETIWASPMATVWLPADVPTLLRLAVLVELANRGDASTGVLTEIRQIEDRFGLSPQARRRLQWEVDRAEQAAATAPPQLADVRRLRAVDTSG